MPTLFLIILSALLFATNTPAALSHNQQLRQELEQIMNLPDHISSLQNVDKILDDPDNSDTKIISEETSDEISTQSAAIEKRRMRKNASNRPNPLSANNPHDVSEDPFEINSLDKSTDSNDDKRRKRKSR